MEIDDTLRRDPVPALGPGGPRLRNAPGTRRGRRTPHADSLPAVGFLGWILLGLFAATIAKALIPGRTEPGGCIGTTAIGVLGAILGGWLATELDLSDHGVDDFFDLGSWLMAIAGSAILLILFAAITRR